LARLKYLDKKIGVIAKDAQSRRCADRHVGTINTLVRWRDRRRGNSGGAWRERVDNRNRRLRRIVQANAATVELPGWMRSGPT